jgi:23S rRNA (cytidine1920-2'-O)/16S rRNA (cytidine1409-2'-O)-methyltransferase
MAKRIRIDILLVERGLAVDSEKAQRHVRAGQVFVEGRLVDKPGFLVDPGASVEMKALGPRFASRGGEKLQGALDRFDLSPSGTICLDIGASTGGFTDCLLQAGARRVYAVDAGRRLLHERLRDDPRVVSLEGRDARRLDGAAIPEPIEFCAVDVSFLSLLNVIPAIAALLASNARLVVLVKPQYEVETKQVGQKGVVRDPEAHRQALGRILTGIAEAGFVFQGVAPSPLRGPAGNIEYLAHFSRAPQPGEAPGTDAVDTAVAEAFASGQSLSPE